MRAEPLQDNNVATMKPPSAGHSLEALQPTLPLLHFPAYGQREPQQGRSGDRRTTDATPHSHGCHRAPASSSPANPPTCPPTEVALAQISAAQLRGILCALPKGVASSPSGWTYEHVRAAANTSVAAFEAILKLSQHDDCRPAPPP
jgi:hypothetical protein